MPAHNSFFSESIVSNLLWILAQTIPDSTSGGDILSLIRDAGIVGVLVWIVLGAMNEWWIPGKTHRRIVAERDELLKLVVGSQTVGERALVTAQVLTEAMKRAEKDNQSEAQ